MKFGLFGGAVAATGSNSSNPPPTSPARNTGPARRRLVESADSHHYLTVVDAIVDAESLGYESAFLVEHHFTGSAQISASLNLLSFVAARTASIRLGTAVIVVPWHDPVLLAEQIATVDVLSGGRLDVGVGRGYRPDEFAHFCIPMSEAEERFDESMALLHRALTARTRFSHHSEHWRYENIVVEPAPVQTPHPPFWVAAGKPESLRAAAERGFNLLLDQFATFDVVLERLSIFKRAVAAAGRQFDPQSVAVARGVAIVDSPVEFEHALEKRMLQLAKMNKLAAGPDGSNVSSMMSDPDSRRAAQDGTLIGTPAQIISQIEHLRAGGVDYLLLSSLMADAARRKRFATEVMPYFAASPK